MAESMREVRLRHGASQMAVANVLDVAQSTVVGWEKRDIETVPEQVRERWEDACREAVQAVGKRYERLARDRKYRAVSGG
jgi:DNA-binding XRE family transcriptional regulator